MHCIPSCIHLWLSLPSLPPSLSVGMGFRYHVEVRIKSWVDMGASYISWMVVRWLALVGLLKSSAGMTASSEPSISTAMDSYFVLVDGCCPMSVPVEQLTRVIKRCLPVITYACFLEKRGVGQKTSGDQRGIDIMCTVCMERVMGEEKVRELRNCEHVFHRECLDYWVDQGGVTCPLCRAMLFPDNLDLAQLRCVRDYYSSPSPEHDHTAG